MSPKPIPPRRPMETLSEAIERLQSDGYTASFRAGEAGRLQTTSGDAYDPEALVVEEVARFEGTSDPGDESLLVALRTEDGSVRGTWSTIFGPGCEPANVAVLERLDLRGDD